MGDVFRIAYCVFRIAWCVVRIPTDLGLRITSHALGLTPCALDSHLSPFPLPQPLTQHPHHGQAGLRTLAQELFKFSLFNA